MRIEIPEKKKLVYEMSIPIRWGDMDAMGFPRASKRCCAGCGP